MKGKEVTIYEDGTTTDYVSEPTDIDYSTLPESVLLKLKSINEEGKELSITNPEIIRILEGPYNVTFTYNGKSLEHRQLRRARKLLSRSLHRLKMVNGIMTLVILLKEI